MLTSSISLKQENFKKSKKSMKIFNIEVEDLYISWMTWGISVEFSGKMWLIITLKVTKNQGFTLSLENKFWKKNTGWGGGASDWPPRFLVFFMNIASNVTYVLLNTYNHNYAETHFIFSIFVSMPTPRSIYVISMWSIFIFSLIFIVINLIISFKQTHLFFVHF